MSSGRRNRAGRPPKPTALHVVDGTIRKHRHGSAEDAKRAASAAAKVRRPSPPTWLKGRGRAEWNRIAPLLHKRGLLTVEDVQALACYCQAVQDVQELSTIVAAEGRTTTTSAGTLKGHPAYSQLLQARRQVREYSALFGLSPVDRARVREGKDGETPEGGLAGFRREQAGGS